MKVFRADVSRSIVLLTLLTATATATLYAQESGVMQTPKLLTIQREFLKPGRDGASHEKTEGVYLRALDAYKSKQSYIAVTSLSGPSRALFMSSFDSFAAWEADHEAVNKNAALAGALDRANVADGDLLSQTDASMWLRDDDLSLNPGWRVGSRYEVLEQFAIKPGHGHEWEELVKLVKEGYTKGVPSEHWAMYEEAYGTPGGRYLVVISVKSAAELDAEFASGKAFADAMGEGGMKKLAELESDCVTARQTNLFLVAPKLSHPPEAMMKAEPDFWKPKMMMPAKKAAQ